MSAWTCKRCGDWFVMNDYEVEIHAVAFPGHRPKEHKRLSLTAEQAEALNKSLGGEIGTFVAFTNPRAAASRPVPASRLEITDTYGMRETFTDGSRPAATPRGGAAGTQEDSRG